MLCSCLSWTLGNGNRSSVFRLLWATRMWSHPSRRAVLDHSVRSHPTEPQCSYDPVEGLPIASNIDPSERIRLLEDQICALLFDRYLSVARLSDFSVYPAQLKSQLNEQRNFGSRSASPSRHAHVRNHFASGSSHGGQSDSGSPTAGGIVLPHASLDVLQDLSPRSNGSHPRGSTGSPELRQGTQQHSQVVPEPFMDVLFSGWDPDLPDPDTLDH